MSVNACDGYLTPADCHKIGERALLDNYHCRAAPLEANSSERNLRVFSKLLGQGDAIDIPPRVLARVGVKIRSRG
jgi:hypothetical protein